MGFLVLNRDESAGVVCILPDGSEIVIQVNKVRGKKVSLSFMAPESVKVLRRELHKNGKSRIEGVVLPGLPVSQPVALG
jgi:sRNA-binding carbon storage regulator CsrA